MPLFGTEYITHRTPESMGFEAQFDDGSILMISPHFCSAHEHESGVHDHRGWLDCTLIQRTPFGVLIPNTSVIDLAMASALVEGITEVGVYVQMNAEADERRDQEEEE